MGRRVFCSVMVCALMLVMAVPLSSCSDADESNDEFRTLPDYLDGDKRITLSGYAVFESENVSATPQILVFIMHYNGVSWEYVNVRTDDKLMSGDVSYSLTGSESNRYRFSVEVPLIDKTKTGVNYAICAFNSYRIWTVSSQFGELPVEVSPMAGATDDGGWDGVTEQTFNVFALDRSVWTDEGVHDGSEVMVTGKDTSALENANKISLKRATGIVTGHVNGIISNSTNPLSDVLVTFSNQTGTVTTTRTDDDGDYTINIPTGTYTVSFSRGNYVCDDVTVTVYEMGVATANANMRIELHNDYFGFDLSHFLMIVGGVVCVLIIIISSIYQYNRIKKGFRPPEWIIDDMNDDGEERR